MSKPGTDLFRNKLEAALNSPQGKEIKKRNWRISDKFKGGFLRGKKSGLAIDLDETHLAAEKDDIDILSEFEGEKMEMPLLKKLPPSTFEEVEIIQPFKEVDEAPDYLKPRQMVDMGENLIYHHDVDREEESETEVEEECQDVATDADRLETFKNEFYTFLDNDDFLGAVVTLLTAIFVVIYTIVRDAFVGVSEIVEEVMDRREKANVQKRRKSIRN